MPENLNATAIIKSLTDKQREVLELLIEHKTSKEISRELGISPHTVDQRLDTVRARLGAKNRSEIAQIYRRLREIDGGEPVEGATEPSVVPAPTESGISERLTHEKTLMAAPAFFTNEGARNDAGSNGSLFGGSPSGGNQNRPAIGSPQAGDTNPDASGDDAETVQDYSVVPELFDGRYGTQARLLAIILIAAAFLVTALTGFSIVKSVSDALQG